MEKAIVLLSGGMNSAVAAASLSSQHELYLLFVNFHQRALGPERRAFEALCNHLKAQRHWTVELSHFKQVGGNAIVDRKRPVPDAFAPAHDAADAFVATLMPVLLDVATSFAFRIGARRIICGASEALKEPGPGIDTLYPDRRHEFFQNYRYLLESALPSNHAVTLETPLIDFSRDEIVKLGCRLAVPFESTWSCYDGGDTPCTRCFGCANRASGFLQAAVADPLIAPHADTRQG